MPQGTFKPAACHSVSGTSVFGSTDEIGTRKRSVPLRPITTPGRILPLVKSVNGIGNRTMSFLEQFIEDVIGVVVPNFGQRIFRQLQPGLALDIG